ncbi:MAG: DUF308 domain-containing protein [Steroidobacteraceae bacterium]
MNAQIRSPLMGLLGRSWWIVLVYGLLGAVFGIVALTRPIATAVALAWTLGIFAIVEGVVTLAAMLDRGHAISRGWLLFYALVSLAFGVLTMLNPVVTASALLFLLAAWLIVGGIYRIVFAIRVRRQIEGEWLIALSGLLGIVLGVMFVLNPVAGIAVTTVWIGALALVYGLIQIFAAFRLRKLVQPG